MSYQIEQKAPCRVTLTATLSPEQVSEQRQRVVGSWRRNARLPGFRKGKAPQEMVERRYAKEIADDLQEELMRRSWDEVRDEKDLRPAGPLEINKAEMRDDGSFEMEGEFDIFPDIELTPTDTFTPPQVAVDPSDEELDEAVERLRDRQAAWDPVEDGTADEGMLVEVALHGEFPDGGREPFDEERSLFQIGRGEVFPEIEAAVKGHAVGDEVSVERTLGEEAGEELAGKRVAYTVRIKSLRMKRLPDLDDAFAASLGVEEGLDELRTRLAARIKVEKAYERRRVWRDALVEHLQGGTEVPVPERVVRDRTRQELIEFAQSLAARGIDPEDADLEWDKIEAEMRERSTATLRGELVLDALADSLDITVDEKDVDAELKKEAANRGVPFGELKGNLAKGGQLDRIRGILKREKAVDSVLGAVSEEA